MRFAAPNSQSTRHRRSADCPSSYFMKSPPRQFTDAEARRRLEEFIAGIPTHSLGPRVTTTFLLVRHAAHDRVGCFLAGADRRRAARHRGPRAGPAARARLAGEGIGSIYASPRKRTQETAAAIAAASEVAEVATTEALDEGISATGRARLSTSSIPTRSGAMERDAKPRACRRAGRRCWTCNAGRWDLWRRLRSATARRRSPWSATRTSSKPWSVIF